MCIGGGRRCMASIGVRSGVRSRLGSDRLLRRYAAGTRCRCCRDGIDMCSISVRRCGRRCCRRCKVRVAVGSAVCVAMFIAGRITVCIGPGCSMAGVGRRSMCVGCGAAMRIRLRGNGGAGSCTVLHAGAARRWCRRCRSSRRIMSSMGMLCTVSVVSTMRIGCLGRGLVVCGRMRIDRGRFNILRSGRLGGPGLALCLFDRLGVGGRRIMCGGLGLGSVAAMRVGFRGLRFCRLGLCRGSLCRSSLRRRSVRIMAAAMIVMRGVGGQCKSATERKRKQGDVVDVHDDCPLRSFATNS